MKPIYKSLTLAAMTLQVSVALQAQVNDGTTASQIDVPAEVLDSLRVELVAPNVSGARDLIKSGECTVSGNDLSISLNAGDWLKGGVYRLQVVATFGTQTQVIYALDVTVPRYETLASEPQEYEDTVTVVSTYGDGDKSGADASVYAKDGDGNAHITTPLSVSGGVATGDGAIASGYVSGEGASIQAASIGSIASGYVSGDGASIQATSDGSIAHGYAGEGASIQATSAGAIASGYVSGEGASIQAASIGSIASGYVSGDGASIQATSDGSIASGNADGEGASIQATSDGSIASGNADGNGSTIQASGTGAVASGDAGDGATIQATSAGSIAHGHAGEGASIQATSDGAIASGYADATYGNVEASGQASQAFGMGTQTQTDGQMVLGKCNVVDTNSDYALIVGNGTDDQNRSNAFAIDWNGNLVLFNNGTPVVLTPAKLATLIA